MLIIIVFILGIVITGCKDLSSFDLSGQVELGGKDNGSPYLEIYSYDQSGVNFLNRLLGYVSMDTLFSKLEFKKDFYINQNNYTVIVKFKGVSMYNLNYLKIFDSNGKEVPFTIVKEEDNSHSGGIGFDLNKDTDPQFLSGYGLILLIDPDSKIECLLKTRYSIKCWPKNVNEEGKGTAASISLSTQTSIGNRYYLHGIRNPSPKETLKINVLDWNIDGVFNDEDMVQIYYGKNHLFPLNKKFKLGSGDKQKEYVMNLKQDDEEGNKYILNINKTQ
ncbi:MAG: hypothetical protein GXY86_15390 [Firmicutes bacterium]|nr:hypothetical protein [Bacillota bacterium]